MTRNTAQRLALFLGGIPLLVLAVLYLPFGRHAVIALVALAVQGIAAVETVRFFDHEAKEIPAWPSSAAAVLTGLSTYMASLFGLPAFEILACTSTVAFLALSAPMAFATRESAPKILRTLGARALTQLYAGVLGSYFILITSGFEQGAAAIFSFLLITFGNDSLAWLFGMTMGKRRGLIQMSPNKSLAGFAGGFLGSLTGALLASILFPRAGFPSRLPLALWSIAIGAVVIVGDLVESAMKRSSGLKDSGAIVPGRGGVLDSFDSLLFAAPVFVVFARLTGMFAALP